MSDKRHEIPDQVKTLPLDAAKMLSAVEPCTSGGGLLLYPCEVETTGGITYPRVYVVDAKSYITRWGVWPWRDSGKNWLPVERIRHLRSSPERLPVVFANQLYEAGESGMGYCVFSVELRSGRLLYFCTGNNVDFLCWPPGVGPADVIAVFPHRGSLEFSYRPPLPHESGADYMWSPHR